jgi:glutathione S-transferase kappa 1
MKESGNQPPAMVPNRADFLAHDMDRNIAWYDLKDKFLGIPQNFFSQTVSKSTMWLNRLICVASSSLSPDDTCLVVRAAFRVFWESKKFRKDENFFDANENELVDELAKILGPQFTTRLHVWVSQISTTGKSRLAQNTKDALEIKAFGSPIFHFPNFKDGGVFFGSDRFEQMAYLFGLKWHGPRGPPVSRL